MPAGPEEPEFSSIEDLDPEPQPRGGRTNAREFLLGLLLVLAVLGWGGWSWAQQESKQSNYRQAQQAAASRDWDEARAHYAAAAGYKDANAHVVEIDKLIARRNMWYTAATQDAGKGDWAASLKAFQTVNDIQPGYADTEQLRKESEARVYQAAVQSAIALRAQAEPPGLYFRDADGWRW